MKDNAMVYFSDMGNDIREITDYANEQGYYFDSPKVVADLWKQFSDEYCAQWLAHDEFIIRHFIEWLEKQGELELL